MIAINIDGLLAQRAGDVLIQHRESEAVSNGGTEDSWLQKGVASILLGRNSSDEPVGVRLGTAPKALCLTLVRGRAHQKGVSFLVEIERRHRLESVFLRHPRWGNPHLFGSLHGFMPACMVGHVRVFGDSTKAKTSQLGSETNLNKRDVVHGKTQDTLDGLPNHLIELLGLILPQAKRGCPHEVNCAHDAVTHAK
jgi:hypothetical protein